MVQVDLLLGMDNIVGRLPTVLIWSVTFPFNKVLEFLPPCSSTSKDLVTTVKDGLNFVFFVVVKEDWRWRWGLNSINFVALPGRQLVNVESTLR